jgi:hypothetical protein
MRKIVSSALSCVWILVPEHAEAFAVLLLFAGQDVQVPVPVEV